MWLSGECNKDGGKQKIPERNSVGFITSSIFQHFKDEARGYFQGWVLGVAIREMK